VRQVTAGIDGESDWHRKDAAATIELTYSAVASNRPTPLCGPGGSIA
jgi:hypothetical protein